MKLEKIHESTLTKTIFSTLAVGTLVGTLLVFPSFGYIVKYFMDDRYNQKYIKKAIRRLEKQQLISIKENLDGQITIVLTEKGKKKALTCQIDSMKIKTPRTWDKMWRIVIFDIPEGKKQARDILRNHLKKLGFYRLQKSVFVHPYPCKDEVDFLKHNFDVADYITYIKAHSLDNQNLLLNHFQL